MAPTRDRFSGHLQDGVVYLGAHARPATLADDLRRRNALSGLGKCHPQTRAFRFPTPEAGPAAEGAPTAAANAAEEPAATDHERVVAAPPPSPTTAASGMSHGRKI